MNNKTERKKELIKAPISRLRKFAGDFDPPIELQKSWTKKQIVNAIVEREQQEQAKPEAATAADRVPTKPDFEAAASAPAETPTEKRGGTRPGAGRPPGLTDEKAKVKNLPQYPSIPIRQGVYVLGQAWAQSVKIPQVAFDDQETDLIALPATQLQEFYFPGLIPEICGVWVSLAYGLAKVVKVRLDLIKEVQAARREGKDVEAVLKGGGNGEARQQADRGQDGQRQDGESAQAD